MFHKIDLVQMYWDEFAPWVRNPFLQEIIEKIREQDIHNFSIEFCLFFEWGEVVPKMKFMISSDNHEFLAHFSRELPYFSLAFEFIPLTDITFIFDPSWLLHRYTFYYTKVYDSHQHLGIARDVFPLTWETKFKKYIKKKFQNLIVSKDMRVEWVWIGEKIFFNSKTITYSVGFPENYYEGGTTPFPQWMYPFNSLKHHRLHLYSVCVAEKDTHVLSKWVLPDSYSMYFICKDF